MAKSDHTLFFTFTFGNDECEAFFDKVGHSKEQFGKVMVGLATVFEQVTGERPKVEVTDVQCGHAKNH